MMYKNKPAVKGWYWYWDPDFGEDYPTICWVTKINEKWIAMFIDGSSYDVDGVFFTSESRWAGPLEHPFHFLEGRGMVI